MGRERKSSASVAVKKRELIEMTAAAGLPAGFLENHLLGSNYPHVASARHYVAVFM